MSQLTVFDSAVASNLNVPQKRVFQIISSNGVRTIDPDEDLGKTLILTDNVECIIRLPELPNDDLAGFYFKVYIVDAEEASSIKGFEDQETLNGRFTTNNEFNQTVSLSNDSTVQIGIASEGSWIDVFSDGTKWHLHGYLSQT